MIPPSQLQEFGFSSLDKFPRKLTQHVVHLSLTSAIEQGTEPLKVTIEDGLMVPLQSSSKSQGMILRHDGSMLYVKQVGVKDPASALAAVFIKEIPYEIRLEISHVMRRAVLADASLAEIWQTISQVWEGWFPPSSQEAQMVAIGEYPTVKQAWGCLEDLIGRWLAQNTGNQESAAIIKLRVLIQGLDEFQKGWMGEEFVVDEASLLSVSSQGLAFYLRQQLFPKMQKALKTPVFSSRSRFQVYYNTSLGLTLKWVIATTGETATHPADYAGIELTLADIRA